MLGYVLPVAKNPDPLLPITSYAGRTRTLDDWATVFNLAIVVLPDRPEGAGFVPIIDRIFATFGDSDVRTIICVPSSPAIAKRIVGAHDRRLVGVVRSRAGVRRQPRARTAAGLRAPAPGHDARRVARRAGARREWQKVANEIARHEHWTSPIVSGQGDPSPTPGWPIAS